MRTTEIAIVGQGIAGSTLAWRLFERGVRAVVIDRGGADESGRPAASRVAAGLVTPVSGKRLTVAADYEEFFAEAAAFYKRASRALRFSIFEIAPAVRLFVDADERALFQRRLADGELGDHARLAEPSDLPAGLAADEGGFVMPRAARLSVGAYLGATRGALIDEEAFLPGDLDPDADVEITDDGVVIPKLELRAQRVVYCTGYTPRPPAAMPTDRWAPAKGELLTVQSDAFAAPEPSADRVVHRGVWMAPSGENGAGQRLVGATYAWERLDSEPTDAGRQELLDRLAAAGVTNPSVVDHQAAVRPATSDRRPIVGLDETGRVGWLNGLGSKGALGAPTVADGLAASLAQRR